MTLENATIYQIKSGVGKAEIDEGINIVQGIIEGRYLEKSKFEFIKEDVLLEIENASQHCYNNNKIYQLCEMQNGRYYASPMGEINDIVKITFSDIVQQYKKSMFSEMAIFVVGDIKDIDYVKCRLKKSIDSVQKQTIIKNQRPLQNKLSQTNLLFQINSSEYEYYIRRNTYSSLKRRCVEDLLFLILENGDFLCFDGKIIQVTCCRKYYIGASYLCISMICDAHIEKIDIKEMFERLIVEGKDIFMQVKVEYILYLQQLKPIDIEAATDELINNFLYDEIVFSKKDYTHFIEKVSFEDLVALLRLLIL